MSKERVPSLPLGINYCALNKPSCEHECVNTEESYYCRCRRGYSLDPNGKTCSREYATWAGTLGQREASHTQHLLH